MIKTEIQQLSEQLTAGVDGIHRILWRLTTTVEVMNADIMALKGLVKQGNKQMANFETVFEDAMSDLQSQVSANTDAEASAAELINKLAQLITANAADPTAVRALAVKLKASADALASAVVANTPVAPTPAA